MPAAADGAPALDREINEAGADWFLLKRGMFESTPRTMRAHQQTMYGLIGRSVY
jgi:hypothetical protein